MRTKTRSPGRFSPWLFLGADILDAYKQNHSGPAITPSQIVAIITIAIEPKTLEAALSHPKARPLAHEYAAALAINPDLVGTFFQLVRNKWHNPNPSHAAIVQKFITTTPWVQTRKGGAKVVLSSKVQDREIRQAMILAGLPKIEPGTIKKARQTLRTPAWRPAITRALNTALEALRELGFCRHW